MHKLIWFFSVRTCQLVSNAVLRLKCSKMLSPSLLPLSLWVGYFQKKKSFWLPKTMLTIENILIALDFLYFGNWKHCFWQMKMFFFKYGFIWTQKRVNGPCLEKTVFGVNNRFNSVCWATVISLNSEFLHAASYAIIFLRKWKTKALIRLHSLVCTFVVRMQQSQVYLLWQGPDNLKKVMHTVLLLSCITYFWWQIMTKRGNPWKNGNFLSLLQYFGYLGCQLQIFLYR